MLRSPGPRRTGSAFGSGLRRASGARCRGARAYPSRRPAMTAISGSALIGRNLDALPGQASLLNPAPPDSKISKARLLGLLAVVDIAKIDQHLAAHRRRDFLEVERSEFVPFGDDHQRIGAVGRRISVMGKVDPG